ncbi:vegetative cell wall protein gp1-like [Ischnura elegans]|uniref:vegetative cell wall protein gp1-like n=1 Tax=Ischnura elegans TaxID=197161 RepID=UPI001ED8A69A|nr:vegetative cell wall protein gp1-like [Ischnura elegans]
MGPKARKGGSANPPASPGGRSRGRSRSRSRSPRQGSPSPTLIPNTSPTGSHMSSEPSSLLNKRVQSPTSEAPPSWLLKAITESRAPVTVSVPQPLPAQQPQPLDPGPSTSRGIPLTQLGLMSEPTPPLVSFPATQPPRPCTPESQVVTEDRRFRDLRPERPPNTMELPPEQECLELLFLRRINASSSKLTKRDGHEVSLLLGIAADWDALPGPHSPRPLSARSSGSAPQAPQMHRGPTASPPDSEADDAAGRVSPLPDAAKTPSVPAAEPSSPPVLHLPGSPSPGPPEYVDREAEDDPVIGELLRWHDSGEPDDPVALSLSLSDADSEESSGDDDISDNVDTASISMQPQPPREKACSLACDVTHCSAIARESMAEWK